MGIGNVIGYEIIEDYVDYGDFLELYGEKDLDRIVENYRKMELAFNKMKINRNNPLVTDREYIDSMMRLFDVIIYSNVDFAKLLLGEDIKKITVFSRFSNSTATIGTAYDAYSSVLDDDKILSLEEIVAMQNERSLILFGKPLVCKSSEKEEEHSKLHVFAKNLDFYDGIFTPEPLDSSDIDFLEKNYPDFLTRLRYGLTDNVMRDTKRKIVELNFDSLEKCFGTAKDYYINKALEQDIMGDDDLKHRFVDYALSQAKFENRTREYSRQLKHATYKPK